MKLTDLGYNNFFEENRNCLGAGDLAVARVIAEHKGAYRVKNQNGEYLAKVTGKQMFKASSREDFPAVGDWVTLAGEPIAGEVVIQSVLPRQTVIKRKRGGKERLGKKDRVQIIATNIDLAFVVESVDRDYSLNRLERYFAIAEDGGVMLAVILNKIDLLTAEELAAKVAEIKKRFPEIVVVTTSAEDNQGLDDLKKYLEKDKTYCFLGSSGVGKSSLINKLLGEESGGETIKTGEVSLTSDRGKHTTTARQMYFLKSGAMVIDNPGMREVGLADAGQGVAETFDEIDILARDCQYVDCTHNHEPDCAVIKAVKMGELDEGKYQNYLRLKKEVDFFELESSERKEKERSFGKFIKKAKKDFKDLGHKGW